MDAGGPQLGMSQKILYLANASVSLRQMGGEGMAQ